MPQARLTDITIKTLKPPERGQITYLDASLPGFGVRVSQGGVKSFVVVHGRSRTRTTLGRYPTISLSDARTEAKRILAETTLGKQRPPTLSFEAALELFLPTLGQRNRASTAKETKRLLNRHFLPPLRNERLEEITTHRIAKLIDRRKETPSEANHAFAAIRLFFRWATRRRLVSHNPCEGLEAPSKPVPRNRVLTDEELPKIYQRAADVGYPFGSIVQLLMLTGQRCGEIAGLRTEYIDFDAQTITLPASLTKNKREHTFPIGPVATALLDRKRQGYQFPARGKDKPFNGFSKGKAAFDVECLVDPWTLHDLRRTFATNLAALGTPVHVTEKLLNHVSGTTGGIVGVYQRHAYLDEMKAAIVAWEEQLAKLLKASQADKAEAVPDSAPLDRDQAVTRRTHRSSRPRRL